MNWCNPQLVLLYHCLISTILKSSFAKDSARKTIYMFKPKRSWRNKIMHPMSKTTQCTGDLTLKLAFCVALCGVRVRQGQFVTFFLFYFASKTSKIIVIATIFEVVKLYYRLCISLTSAESFVKKRYFLRKTKIIRAID